MRRVNCKYCQQSFLTAQTGDECPLCKKPDGIRQNPKRNPSDTSDSPNDLQVGDGVGVQTVGHPAAAPVISISDIIEQNAPRYKLFSAASVVLASLLTVVGGAVVLAINCSRLSRPIRGVVILIVLGTPAVLVDVFLNRDADGRPMPFSALWILRALVMLPIAYSVQGRAVIDHELAGGKLDSWWKALVIGWVAMFVVEVIAEFAG